MSDLIIPEPAIIIPRNPRLSDFSREREYWYLNRNRLTKNDVHRKWGFPLVDDGDKVIPTIAGGASFSDYLELKVLDYIFNDPSTAFVSADPYLALWQSTATLNDAATGATANECSAVLYTTYARQQVTNTLMSAAAAGSKTNSGAITFAACTATSATVTWWGTTDAAGIGAGNMLVWGTCTSTTVDTSHTPPTVAIGALTVTLD